MIAEPKLKPGTPVRHADGTVGHVIEVCADGLIEWRTVTNYRTSPARALTEINPEKEFRWRRP